MPGLSGAEPAWVTRRRVHLTLDVHLIDCVPEEAVETLVTCSHMLEMLNIHFHGFLPRNDFDFSIFIILSRPLPFHCNQYSGHRGIIKRAGSGGYPGLVMNNGPTCF